MAPSNKSQTPQSFVGWLANNKQHLAVGVGAAAAAYLAYRAYTSESASQLAKLKKTVNNYGAALASISSSAALVASDLHSFLSSDTQELPRSLRQLNRLLQSQDVQETIVSAAASVTKGVSQASAASVDPNATPMLDKILEAVLSDRGRSLVGMAVGLATKNATSTLCSFLERMQQQSRAPVLGEHGEELEHVGGSYQSTITAVVSLLASEQGEKVLSLLITKSIKTAVSTYVDATIGYNIYDDMVASIAKQEHRDAVTDIMSRVTAAFCREVALAYQKSTYSSANSSNSNTPRHHANHHHNHRSSSPALSTASSTSTSSMISLVGHTSAAAADASPRPSPAPPAACAAAACSDKQGMARRHSVDTGAAACKLLPAAAHASMARSGSGGLVGVRVHGPSHGSHGHKANHPKPATPAWLRQVVDLAKEQDVRALALDVVASATREATRSTIETLLNGASQAVPWGKGAQMTQLVAASRYQVYVVLSMAIAMVMYAMAPRTIMG